MLQHVSAKLTPRDASPQQATSDALRGWLTSYIDRRAGKARRESGASRVRVLFDMLDVLPHRRGTTATVPHDAAPRLTPTCAMPRTLPRTFAVLFALRDGFECVNTKCQKSQFIHCSSSHPHRPLSKCDLSLQSRSTRQTHVQARRHSTRNCDSRAS
jgi:hypothetical protein